MRGDLGGDDLASRLPTLEDLPGPRWGTAEPLRSDDPREADIRNSARVVIVPPEAVLQSARASYYSVRARNPQPGDPPARKVTYTAWRFDSKYDAATVMREILAGSDGWTSTGSTGNAITTKSEDPVVTAPSGAFRVTVQTRRGGVAQWDANYFVRDGLLVLTLTTHTPGDEVYADLVLLAERTVVRDR